MSIDWEIEELACTVCGKTEEEKDEIINNSEVDDILFDKYEIDFDTYSKIVQDLLPLTPIIKTAITGTLYHAFVKDNFIIVRKEAEVKEPEENKS